MIGIWIDRAANQGCAGYAESGRTETGETAPEIRFIPISINQSTLL